MSILKVDTINEKTSGNGVAISGHVVQFETVTRNGASNSTSSTSFVDTGLSLTITKILLVENLGVIVAVKPVST